MTAATTDATGAPRPNDALRAGLLAALDLADRAGVALTYVTGQARESVVREIGLMATADDGTKMSRGDALRIVLRATPGTQPRTDVYEDATGAPWATLTARHALDGADLVVYTAPTDGELAAAHAAFEAVEAVTQP